MSLEVTRERVVQALCAHFAQDRLTMDELESRLQRAQRAASEPQLASLVVDLPALPEIPLPGMPSALPQPFPVTTRPSPMVSSTVLDAAAVYTGPAIRDELPREDEQSIFTMMGGVERKGVWVPPRDIHCTAIWAGVVLDFREALLSSGVMTVNVFVMMGGVEIILPPGVAVEVNGNAMMGAFYEEESGSPMPITADSPVLRITGFALMAGVDISVRYPGETAKDAKRRRKAQKKLMSGS